MHCHLDLKRKPRTASAAADRLPFMYRPANNLIAAAVFVLLAPTESRCADEPTSAAEAHGLFLQGKYTEAGDLYAKLAKQQPAAAAIGSARCLTAVGKYGDAAKLLTSAAAKSEKQPEQVGTLKAELAVLALDRGDLTEAGKQSQAALALLPDGPQPAAARWVAAELHRRAGRLDEALAGYKWFVDLYNREDSIRDPDVLRYIGLAAAQYARWQRLSDQFNFLVNELSPDTLKLEPDYWPAHLDAGLLYLEKYNQADAAREFKRRWPSIRRRPKSMRRWPRWRWKTTI